MAAGRLGAPFAKVSVELGDSRYPPAPVAGGSNTAKAMSARPAKAMQAGPLRPGAVPAKQVVGPVALSGSSGGSESTSGP